MGQAFAAVANGLGGLDLLVYSLVFAQAHDLQQRFIETKRDDFWLALDVICYSLVAMARLAEPLMEARGGGSTITDLGGERAVPGYNVIGVAKAAHNVGKAAAYLLDAENVTGTVAYVDAGYHAMGL